MVQPAIAFLGGDFGATTTSPDIFLLPFTTAAPPDSNASEQPTRASITRATVPQATQGQDFVTHNRTFDLFDPSILGAGGTDERPAVLSAIGYVGLALSLPLLLLVVVLYAMHGRLRTLPKQLVMNLAFCLAAAELIYALVTY